MSRVFPLQSLLDLSQLRLDEAGRKLGELIAGEQEASRRHGLLVQYREEYRTRFVRAAQDGLRPGEWQNYTQFIARLDEAINQASSAMNHTRQMTVAGQVEWISKRGRVKAFDTLSDRHQSRITYQDQRQEQKASDEHGARRHAEKAKD
ncbi:flagellar export protein FliJ [Sulfuritalea hydrogenivorans]|jgi:flagellar FliJ protein|uniref:Flagellar FliJ protein n=1 Tax=Sulfuritalea hydrogenivorans sk43H TaxID=1223802 RepID=W0SBZ6_9PROT|nr:flagellar export protein FliJ [Sulfuritalea hydrogenivorans]MDK9715035.1 flagellar export protein FliJ [Sulfuritalea sp.]BAO28744.1 flagellar protein [Sulfuritalea hydrogenivorans sk43H]